MSSIFGNDDDEFFAKLKSDPMTFPSFSNFSKCWVNTLNNNRYPTIKRYTIDDVEKIFKLILDKGKAQILFSLKSEDELESTIAKNLLNFYSKMKEE